MSSQQPDAAQIRGALGLLRWENQDLAKACNVTAQSISNIKNGTTRPQPRILSAIRRVLEYQGIEFLDNSGLRFKPSDIEIYEGAERFVDFYNFVYEHLNKYGGTVCVSGVDETMFARYRPAGDVHRIRMTELAKTRKDFAFQILVKEGDHNFTATAYAKYRWQAREYFYPTPFYVFGNCLALISFAHEPPPYVVLHKSGPFAEAYRHSFNIAWKNAKEPPG